MTLDHTELLKATLVCGDYWYGADWQGCKNCPLKGVSSCTFILSSLQESFIREHIKKDEEK